MTKVAFVTGITGQDGSLLARLLLEKGYTVHGLLRRSSSFNTGRIDDIFSKLNLHFGDMTDALSLQNIIAEIQPDEIYNLAAQSHVKVSFEVPAYTASADALGVLNLLEAVRSMGTYKHRVKIYQASTSEMYGNHAPRLVMRLDGWTLEPTETRDNILTEDTPFNPVSPYGAAKLYAHNMCGVYRDSYDMDIARGILFNHESTVRGNTFITKKVTRHVASVKCGNKEPLIVGNLDAERDWGWAPDYVRAMWMMLQPEEPTDYVVATGVSHTVKYLIDYAYSRIGIDLNWRPYKSTKFEEAIDDKTGDVMVRGSHQYTRPNELHWLRGDSTKIREALGWKPTITFEKMISDMVLHDWAELRAK